MSQLGRSLVKYPSLSSAGAPALQRCVSRVTLREVAPMTTRRWPKVAAARGPEKKLRDFALRYPDAMEEFPWGERVIKVNKKVFVFISRYQGSLRISTKLPDSGVAALTLPFAEPTGYGLGKSGWVTAHFDDDGKAPVELLCSWIDESYRAVAPKRLVDRLGAKTANDRT